MPQYLRSVRQARWRVPEWVGPDSREIQADSLKDLATQGNLLSVYRADSQDDVERITVALAATRENLQNVDYAVFDDTEFQEAGIVVNKSSGATPDQAVNELHYDLGQLTARQNLRLAQMIANGKVERRPRKMIMEGLRQAIDEGELDDGDISDRLRSQLQ